MSLACTSNGGTEPDPTPAIDLTLSAASATVEQAGSTIVTATVTRSGGFTAAVTFSVAGAPSGVTGLAGDVQTTGDVTTASITMLVDAAVAPGLYTLTVSASGSGVPDATVDFELTVTARSDYALGLNPSALTIQQGGTDVTEVIISRVNFPNPVTLSLDNPPVDAGGRIAVTSGFDPSPATGNAATLTLTVSTSLGAGDYNLTVRGTAEDFPDRSATLVLTVIEPPDYALTVDPNALTIAQGSNAQTTVTIVRINFGGPVTLSLGGAPAGVTGVFDPTAPTGTTSTLTVSVDGSVPVGDYSLTVNGMGSPGDRDVLLTLSVTAP